MTRMVVAGPCVVVTGGRHFANQLLVFRVLDALQPSRVSEGDCPSGADLFARQWRDMNGVAGESYAADWYPAHLGGRLDRGAGPRRNGRMLRAENPNLVIAFRGNRGTRDCSEQARAMNIPVLEVT